MNVLVRWASTMGGALLLLLERIIGFFSNLRRVRAPLPPALRRLAANVWARAKTRSLCCGKHGEEGC